MKIKLDPISTFVRRFVSSAPGIFWTIGISLLLIHYGKHLAEFSKATIPNLLSLDSENLLFDIARICIIIGITIWILRMSLIQCRIALSKLEKPTSPSIVLTYVYMLPRLFLYLPKHLFDRYRESGVANVLESLQPVSTVLAVVALFATSYGLWLTSMDMAQRTKQMHATLRISLDEKLAAASIKRDDIDLSKCADEIPADNAVLTGMLERTAALGVPLHGIRAVGVPLSGVSLENTEFEYGVFGLSDLSSARFSGVVLSWPEFFCTNLNYAKFIDADLISADFRLAKLRDVDFRDATLYNANFLGAMLDRADFRKADLLAANFSGARLDKADFTGATRLSESQIENACVKREKNRPKGLPPSWKILIQRNCPDESVPLW